MKKLALFTRYRRSGGTSTPFGQLGPTLDLNFAGAPTTGLVSNNNSLDLNFVDNAYTLGAPYMVWGNDGMQAANFEDIITFSRATGNATYYNSSGYLTLAGILNYLLYSNQPENAAWTKTNSFIQQNLLTYSNQPDNAVWTKSNAFVQSNLLTYSGQFDNAAWVKNNSFVQTNLLQYSEQFENAYWTALNVSTPTANSTIAPDGTLTAETLTSSNSASATTGVYRSLSYAAVHSLSVYAKANTSSIAWVSSNSGESYGVFNLSTGTVISSGNATASIVSVGNGWYRLIVANTTVASTYFILGGKDSYTSGHPWSTGTWTSGNSIYIWGAQCVQGSVAGDYQVTTSAAATVTYPNWDGRRTARKLCEDSVLTTHEVKQDVVTLATQYTFSAYVKAGERTFAMLYHGNSNSAQVIDLTTGAAAGNAGLGAPLAYSIASLSNGWYRVAITVTATAAANNFRVYPLANATTYSYTGNGSSGIYISDSQLVQGSVAGDYQGTTAAALPVLYPDYNGALRARKLCEDAAVTTTHWVFQSITTIAATYTVSEVMKAGERTWALIRIRDSSGNDRFAWFNLAAGTIGSVQTNLTASMVSLGSGWYRCSVTVSAAVAAANPCVFGPVTGDGVATYTGDGSSGIYIADAQLVQGSVPGDYRETTTAALPCLYADYNGALRARKFCEDATASTTHRILPGVALTIDAAGTYTYSWYVKAGELTEARLTDNNVLGATFNLTTGASSSVSSGYTASSVSLSNGWWRLIISGAAVTANGRILIYLSKAGSTTYTGDGSSGIYVADAQLNDGSSALPYYDTTASAYNAPRFDYDPVTLVAKGLLIEEQRTNLLYQSNDFQTSWAPTNITRTLNSILSPSGNVDGVKLAATTATTATLYQTATVAATSATGSVYVKQGTGATTANSFVLRNFTTSTNLIAGALNYSTGVWAYSIGSTGVVVTNIGNGWWRLQISATSGITSGDSMGLYVGFSGGTFAAGDFVYAYGAQLEAGAFATSYIPTTTSQLTRAADTASVNTLSPWYNSAAGTWYFNGETQTFPRYLVVDNSGAAKYPMYVHSAAGGIGNFDGTNLTLTGNNTTARTTFKAATTYSGSVATAVLNGGTVATGTYNGAFSTIATFKLGGATGAGGEIDGHILRLSYYPRRLTDTELQTLTT